VSKQHAWGPAETAKARAMHATAFEIEAQRRAINLETPGCVQTMLGKGCGKPLRSRTTLGKAKAAK
jgi:hypothetical protein